MLTQHSQQPQKMRIPRPSCLTMGDRGPQTGLQLAQLGGCSSGPSPGLRAPLPLLFGSVLCLDSIAIIIVFILCMSHSVHPLIRNMWENALCFLSVLSGARTPESWEEFQRPWLPATLLPPRQREREKSKSRPSGHLLLC